MQITDEAATVPPLAPDLGRATLAGLATALVGAAGWAVVVYLTKMELGLIAVALGIAVGYAVQWGARGVDARLGILGGGLAALSWALGTILADVALFAEAVGQSLLDVFARLGVADSLNVAVQGSGALDLLFLAIAIWEGYRFALKPQSR